MLGRNSYTRDEIDAGRNLVDSQLGAYAALVDAVESEAPDGTIETTLADLEGVYFNALALALDRLYVHRIRATSGKDSTPLNELELIVESLISNGGRFRGNTVLKYAPERSITGLREGDRISLDADQFERLANAVLGELEKKFLK
jgi:hypothetical protein